MSMIVEMTAVVMQQSCKDFEQKVATDIYCDENSLEKAFENEELAIYMLDGSGEPEEASDFLKEKGAMLEINYLDGGDYYTQHNPDGIITDSDEPVSELLRAILSPDEYDNVIDDIEYSM